MRSQKEIIKSARVRAAIILVIVALFTLFLLHLKQVENQQLARLVGKTYVMRDQGIIGMTADTTYVVLKVPNEIANLITDNVVPVAISANDIKTVLYEVKVNPDGGLKFMRTRSLVKR